MRADFLSLIDEFGYYLKTYKTNIIVVSCVCLCGTIGGVFVNSGFLFDMLYCKTNETIYFFQYANLFQIAFKAILRLLPLTVIAFGCCCHAKTIYVIPVVAFCKAFSYGTVFRCVFLCGGTVVTGLFALLFFLPLCLTLIFALSLIFAIGRDWTMCNGRCELRRLALTLGITLVCEMVLSLCLALIIKLLLWILV